MSNTKKIYGDMKADPHNALEPYQNAVMVASEILKIINQPAFMNDKAYDESRSYFNALIKNADEVKIMGIHATDAHYYNHEICADLIPAIKAVQNAASKDTGGKKAPLTAFLRSDLSVNTLQSATEVVEAHKKATDDMRRQVRAESADEKKGIQQDGAATPPSPRRKA